MLKKKYLLIIAGKLLGIAKVSVSLADEAGQESFRERLTLVVEENTLQVIASSNPESQVEGVTLALSDIRLEVTGPLDAGQKYLRSVLRAYWAPEIELYFELFRNEQLKPVSHLERAHFRRKCAVEGEFKMHTDYGYVVVSRHLYPNQPVEAGFYFRLESAPAGHPVRTAMGGDEVIVAYPGGMPARDFASGSKCAILAEELGKVIVPLAARQPVTVW